MPDGGEDGYHAGLVVGCCVDCYDGVESEEEGEEGEAAEGGGGWFELVDCGWLSGGGGGGGEEERGDYWCSDDVEEWEEGIDESDFLMRNQRQCSDHNCYSRGEYKSHISGG